MLVARSRAFFGLLLLPLLAVSLPALSGCDSDPEMPDAGEPDAGEPDAGPDLACTSTMQLDAVLGDTVSVMLDTTMTDTRPRDLGLECGNIEAELRWARQEVLELHVPGSGPVAIQLDTLFEETDITFNTVIQARTTCEVAPVGAFPPTCFDDLPSGDLRSQGTIAANGGDVLYLFVTGYSSPPAEQGTVDEGRIRLDVTVRSNTPPVLTDAVFAFAGDDVRIRANGTDADGDARGVALNFYGPDGELLDIYGDGEATEEGDVFVVGFSPAPTGTTFSGTAEVRAADIGLGPYLRAVGSRRVRVRVFDSGYASSNPVDVDLIEAPAVGLAEACDFDTICRAEMRCTSGFCAVPGVISSACGRASILTVPTPTDTAESVTFSSTTGSGLGSFRPRDVIACGGSSDGTIGLERIYRVDVPDGTFDMLVTTDLSGTGTTNTIVYVRSICADSGSELGCSDDIAPDNAQSSLELLDVTLGTYHVFVERWGGLSMGTIPHEIQITLRPVLATGASCDDTGVLNRCSAGACTASVCP